MTNTHVKIERWLDYLLKAIAAVVGASAAAVLAALAYSIVAQGL
jgi:hypothetical protein